LASGLRIPSLRPCDAADGIAPAGRHVVELGDTHREDPPVAAHPEPTPPVLEDLEDHVVEQTLARRVGGDAVRLDAPQAAAVGPHPEHPAAVHMKRADEVVGEAVVGGMRDEVAVAQRRQPSIGGDPERAVAVLEQGAKVIARQPVRRGERYEAAAVEAGEASPIGADP